LLLITSLRYSRALDLEILGELGNLLSYACFIFLAVRFGDLVWRGQLHSAFALNKWSVLFLIETTLILIPAIALRSRAARETPRTLLNMATLACLGGMFYRFIPTTFSSPHPPTLLHPTPPPQDALRVPLTIYRRIR